MSSDTIVKCPQRLQLCRKAGFRLPPNGKSVARPGIYGNPFHLDDFELETSMRYFRMLFEITPALHPENGIALAWTERLMTRLGTTPLAGIRERLRGYDLGCWCRLDAPLCHADILIELANP